MPLSAPPLGNAGDVDSQVHPVETLDGYGWFTASHAAASLAIADVQASQASNGNGATVGVFPWAAMGAIAGVVGATGVWGNLGVSTANLVMGTLKADENDNSKPASLQVTITNQSSRIVALYKTKPENAVITNVVPPLASGESGVFVVTYGAGFSSVPNNNNGGTKISSFDLVFRVGGGNDYAGNAVTNATYVELDFTYVVPGGTPSVSPPGRWTLEARIDSSQRHTYEVGENTLQLLGGSFIGNPGSPAFAFYTYSIESGSGQIDIVFYDCAAGAPKAAPVCLLLNPGGVRDWLSGPVTVRTFIVGSMNYVSNVSLTVTQVSNHSNSWTSNTVNWVGKGCAEIVWDTAAKINNNQPQFPNGTYRLSVSATNESNLTGTSEVIYTNVYNPA